MENEERCRDRLDEKLLSAVMREAGLPADACACYFAQLESTNLAAKQFARQGMPHWSCVVADTQTAGRGRLSRSWESPLGGLYLSILFRPKLSPQQAPLFTLLAALSVCETLERLGVDAEIKWPNDILVSGKKICGISLESSADIEGIRWIILGIGINIRQKQAAFASALSDKATSLALCGKSCRRSDVLRELLCSLHQQYHALLDAPERLLARYREKCITLGSRVQVAPGDGSGGYWAQAVDVAADGALMIVRDGKKQAVYAGDVSIRGVMGYV